MLGEPKWQQKPKKQKERERQTEGYVHKGEVMCCRHETQTICGYRLSTSEEEEKEEVEEEEEEERRMANIRWVNVIVFPNYVRNNRACD